MNAGGRSVRRGHRRPGWRIALLVVGLAAWAVSALPAGAQTGGAVQVGDNVRLIADPPPARAQDVPGLAVDPDDPNHIVEVHQSYRDPACTYHVSFDGGRTWEGGELPAPDEFEDPVCDPLDVAGYSHLNNTIAFGSDDNVYTTYSIGDRREPGGAIVVASSTDGGRSFDRSTVVVRGRTEPSTEYTRPALTAVPGAEEDDEVFVSGWGLFPCDPGCEPTSTNKSKVVFFTSADGADSFEGPFDVSPPTEYARDQSNPVVTEDGTIHLAYKQHLTQDRTTELRLATSTDRGRTWNRQTLGPADEIFEPKPVLAHDPRDGNLYITYQAHGPGGDFDAFVQRSTDGGATWSARVRINDDPEDSGATQCGPWPTVGPSGTLHVVWYDRRHAYPGMSANDCGFASNVGEDLYYASSTDGGETFSNNRRITDYTSNRNIGLRNEIGMFWSPVAVPLDGDRVLAAWVDSREGSFDDNNQDIYLATIDLDADGPPPVRTVEVSGTPQGSVIASRLARPGGGEEGGGGGFGVGHDPPGGSATWPVIVNGSDVALALAGGVLGRGSFGPVLTSPAAGLPDAVTEEVSRLRPSGAFVVGGQQALSSQVEADLVEAGVSEDDIVRIAGDSPADTARLIAERLDTRSDTDRLRGRPAFDAAVIVNPGTSEASAAANLAATERLPVLFVDTDEIPEPTRQALDELDIDRTLVVGATGVISDEVAGQLPDPTRLDGADVYATSDAVVAESVERGLATNVVYVADGTTVMDAVILGGTAARRGGLLMLVPGADPAAAQERLADLGLLAGVDRLVVAAGTDQPAPNAGAQDDGAAAGDDDSRNLPATGGGLALLGIAALVVAASVIRKARLADGSHA